jgi:hypothetical protein
VVGGRREVRNDPIEDITVSDYLSALALKRALSLPDQYTRPGRCRIPKNPPSL